MPDALTRGDSVGGYKIRQLVGEGATGRVYAAIHPMTGDKVAVRVVHPQLEADADAVLETLRRLEGLKHENLTGLLGCGRLENGATYLVMEFVQGRPLSDLLDKSAPLAAGEAAPLLDQLAAGIAAAHERDVVHGALSADTIWLSPTASGSWPPRLRVMDTGLGQLAALEARAPYYLAPEQCRGEPARPASDRYALGVIAHQLLAGRLPFSSPRPAEVRRMHLEQEPPRLPGRAPGELAELVLRLLAKEPGERPSLSAVREALAGPWPETPEQPEQTPNEAAADEGGDEEGAPASDEESAPAPVAPAPAPSEREPLEVTDDPSTRPLLSPLLSAVLAVVLAVLVVAVGYRVLTGAWPFARAEQTAARGQLLLKSVPAGAGLYLDGARQAGTTPSSLTLRQGQTYEIYLHHPGFRPWRQRVALGIGEARRVLEIPLQRQAIRFGTLKVGSNVKGDVFFDGRRVGAQTREVTLADVQADVDHLIRITAPGHEPVEQTLRVPAGKLHVLQFELQPAQAAGRETKRQTGRRTNRQTGR